MRIYHRQIFHHVDDLLNLCEAIPEAGCWIWLRTRTGSGYGLTNHNGKRIMTHRLAYSLANNLDIASSEHVCHVCDNKLCVNPEHLFLGDNKINMEDKARKGKALKGSQNPGSKLNEQQVLRIKSLRGKKPSNTVGKEFGVNGRQIRKIWSGLEWAWLKETAEDNAAVSLEIS